MPVPPLSLLLALAFAVADDDPNALVLRLGSRQAAERDAAFDSLAALGPAALPALRMVDDPEINRIAAELIDRIGTRRLYHGTTTRLPAGAAPVDDQVAEIVARSGFPVRLDLPAADARRRRSVTIPADPANFWEALDRLAGAAGLAVAARPGEGISLVDPAAISGADHAEVGPFRVDLAYLDRYRYAVESEGTPHESFTVGLRILAEPGILIGRNGPPRVLEAADDLGHDLRASANTRPAVAEPVPSSPRWIAAGPEGLAATVPLDLPVERGRRIARLRGFVPITAIARTDEILQIPLDGEATADRSVGVGALRVTVKGRPAGRNDVIRVALSGVTIGAMPMPPATTTEGPHALTLATLHPAFHPDNHLRIDDAAGRPIPLVFTRVGATPNAPIDFEIRLGPLPGGKAPVPAVLRVLGVAAIATEVPFDLRDLAIP